MDFRKEIINKIKVNRPKITSSSVVTYASLLFTLNKKLGGDSNLEWFTKSAKAIVDHVEENKVKQTQKTLLSALYILTGLEEYKTLMLTICHEVNLEYISQKLNPKQKANRVSWETVLAKYEQVKKILKADPSEDNYVNFFIIACMSGVLWPPRRNEWVYVKLKNYNKEDNYYQKKTIYFNKYKTAYKYKEQTI